MDVHIQGDRLKFFEDNKQIGQEKGIKGWKTSELDASKTDKLWHAFCKWAGWVVDVNISGTTYTVGKNSARYFLSSLNHLKVPHDPNNSRAHSTEGVKRMLELYLNPKKDNQKPVPVVEKPVSQPVDDLRKAAAAAGTPLPDNIPAQPTVVDIANVAQTLHIDLDKARNQADDRAPAQAASQPTRKAAHGEGIVGVEGTTAEGRAQLKKAADKKLAEEAQAHRLAQQQPAAAPQQPQRPAWLPENGILPEELPKELNVRLESLNAAIANSTPLSRDNIFMTVCMIQSQLAAKGKLLTQFTNSLNKKISKEDLTKINQVAQQEPWVNENTKTLIAQILAKRK